VDFATKGADLHLRRVNGQVADVDEPLVYLEGLPVLPDARRTRGHRAALDTGRGLSVHRRFCFVVRHQEFCTVRSCMSELRMLAWVAMRVVTDEFSRTR